MATSAWIESAARMPSRRIAAGIESTGQHILNLARADERREERERDRAARTVRRMAVPAADEVLAMLGLGADHTTDTRGSTS